MALDAFERVQVVGLIKKLWPDLFAADFLKLEILKWLIILIFSLFYPANCNNLNNSVTFLDLFQISVLSTMFNISG